MTCFNFLNCKMTSILKKWLSMRLGVSFNWSPEDFGMAVRDGVLISQLLKSYNVISAEKNNSIVCSNDIKLIKNNLLTINDWLKEINIDLNTDDIENIAQGTGSVALKLFYQMFLELDGKDRFYFITKQTIGSVKSDSLVPTLTPVQSFVPISKTTIKKNKGQPSQEALEKTTNDRVVSETRTLQHSQEKNEKTVCAAHNYTYGELRKLEEIAKENMKNVKLINKSRAQQYKNKLEDVKKEKIVSTDFLASTENTILEKMLTQCKLKEDAKNKDKKLISLAFQEKKMSENLLKAKHEMTLVVKNRINQQLEREKVCQIKFSTAMDDLKNQIKQKSKQVEFEKEIIFLFSEKLHLKETKKNFCETFKICKDTISAILYFTFQLIDFKQMSPESEIPIIYLHEWKTLLINGDFEKMSTGVENIEQVREEERCILDEEEFVNYIEKFGSWNVELPSDGNINQCEYLESQSLYILGCILQKLLAAKYPTPQYQYQDPLPSKKVASILLNAKDVSENLTFVDLLSEKNIFIIHINEAIKFCLDEYKKELIEFDEMNTDFKAFEVSLNTSRDDKSFVNLEESESTVIENVKIANKHSQTPNKLPLVDTYSIPALLGNAAYECLKNGDFISDDLLASITVEFLRYNVHFDGWILIDYPRTFMQAKILEEKMSGLPINIKPEYMGGTKYSKLQEQNIDNSGGNMRQSFQSRIIPKVDNTKVKSEETATFFTTFMMLKQSLCIANENFIWKLTEENSTLIERFYADLGINYSIYYERFDETTIEFIVQYVTGEIGKNAETSQIVSKSNAESQQFMAENSKIMLLKNELIINEKSNSIIISEKISDIKEEEKTSEGKLLTENFSESSSDENNFFTYINIPLVNNILVYLASVWEANEQAYVNDLKDLFNAKRTVFTELIPYVSYVRKNLVYPTLVNTTADDIVTCLQKELNSLDVAMLSNPVIKSDMYCKVKEMQNELLHISEVKMVAFEEKMQKILKEDWLSRNLLILTNCFVSIMEVELNRTQETLKLISNYYDAYFENDLNKDELNAFNLLKLSSGFSKIGESEIKSQERLVENSNNEGNNFNVDFIAVYNLQTALQNEGENTDENETVNEKHLSNNENPFCVFLQSSKLSAETYLECLHSFYKTLTDKEKSKLFNNAKTKTNSKPKRQSLSKEKINSIGSMEINPTDVIEEWDSINIGEICRCKNRLKIIYLKGIDILSQCIRFIVEALRNMSQDAESIHKQEINKITMVYGLFNLAIEKEYLISYKLNFQSPDFENTMERAWNLIIEKDSLRFVKRCDFPVGELAKLQQKLMTIAKNCSIPKKTLIILLQDFFIMKQIMSQSPHSSYDWNYLEPDDFYIIVNHIYGDINYVDWRHFLILCLDIKFPEQSNLLDLRNKFMEYDTNKNETIDREAYYQVILWFEPEEGCKDNHHILRCCLIKEFLFLLFEVSADILNYSAFLLTFCKMENPEDGFRKSLSLALGKPISNDVEKCKSYENTTLVNFKLKRELHRNVVLYAESLVSSIVDYTIRKCSDVNISDIITPKTSECFNKKFLGSIYVKNKQIIGKSSKTSHLTVDSENSRNSSSQSVKSKNTKSKSVTIVDTKSEIIISDVEVYLVSEDLVKRVLLASLPWNCRIEFADPYSDIITGLSQTFVELKCGLESDCVFVHRLLQHQFIKTLLHTIHTFKVVKPCSIATELILDRKNAF